MSTALITGASAGLGQEFAWQLAAARHDLVLVARDGDRLERLAGELESVAGVRVEVLPADLSVRADLDRVADRLRAGGHRVAGPQGTQGAAPAGQRTGGRQRTPGKTRPIGLLVNNAGFGLHQPFIGGDIEEEIGLVDVMIKAVLVLSQAAAEQMTARRRGAILNVSSIAALNTGGTYSAAKAWVRTFTEGLAVELAGTGVTATALCPGLVHTEFHERAGVDYSALPEFTWLNARQVVETALADVRRGAVISTPSLRYQAAAAFLRLAPRPVVRALSRATGGRR